MDTSLKSLQTAAIAQLKKNAESKGAFLAFQEGKILAGVELPTFKSSRMELVENKGTLVYAKNKIRMRVAGYKHNLFLPTSATVADAFKLVEQYLRDEPDDLKQGFRLIARPEQTKRFGGGMSIVTKYGVMPGSRYVSTSTFFTNPNDQRPLLPYVTKDDTYLGTSTSQAEIVYVQLRKPRESKTGFYFPGKAQTAIRFKTATASQFEKLTQRVLWRMIDRVFNEAKAVYGQLFAAQVISKQRNPGMNAPKDRLITFAKHMQQYMPEDAPMEFTL